MITTVGDLVAELLKFDQSLPVLMTNTSTIGDRELSSEPGVTVEDVVCDHGYYEAANDWLRELGFQGEPSKAVVIE